MILRKCKGCGAILQETDQSKAGYVQEIKAPSQEIYCKRCFRLKHYNELPKILADNKTYELVIDNVVKQNGLVVLIVDIFDFTGSFIPSIINKFRGKNIILVANKFDLLPKSTNPTKIVDWISKMCNKVFLPVDAIHVVSSKKGYYLDDLMNTIDFLRKGRDVYFVGCANVGKSSLINSLLKRFTSLTTDVISTSIIPGTTIDSIKIPFFEDNQALIDTPGLINEASIISRILPVSYKNILPTTEIKPITYQLTGGNSILISGLAVISVIEPDNISLTCYFSDKIIAHRTKTEKVLELLDRHLGGMLNPPSLEESKNIVYEDLTFDIKGDKKHDIVISGLGFITTNKPCVVKVKVIKGTDVFIRNAIIGS